MLGTHTTTAKWYEYDPNDVAPSKFVREDGSPAIFSLHDGLLLEQKLLLKMIELKKQNDELHVLARK